LHFIFEKRAIKAFEFAFDKMIRQYGLWPLYRPPEAFWRGFKKGLRLFRV
jgi:hypothetical protein